MSRVFVAHDRTLDRDLVVKVLPPDMAAGVSGERFEREIQVAARLQHPHIVPLLSTGETAGLPYFVMPFIAGESLRDRLQRAGELPVPETVRILRDVATALDYAHRQGVVHRDVKPENILLTDGTAVVTDFGVAKALAAATGGESTHTLTTRGVALGTPAYMAPEQAAADPTTDHRADIYAWGIVAYEMLSGRTPFAGRPPQAQFAAHMAEQPTHIQKCREGVPEQLCALVMRSLAKRPADRPQNAAELIQTLDAFATGAILTPTGTLARRQPKRRSVLAGAAIAVIVLAALWFARDYRRPGPSLGVKSIAVLPFVALGGGDEYFSEGMSDELSAALGRVPGVQVASRTSTFAFKGESVNVRDVGRRLRVDAVLEGRVRRAGDRLRVTAQLTDAVSGLSLWADSYERQSQDVFAVQDDIARSIASALQVRLAATAAPPRETRGTEDLTAYDLYLRGRYHWHRRGAENLRQAINYFERAIQRDSRFARAYAGLAIAAVLLPEYSDVADERALEQRAETAVERALALDSTIAEAHAARGLARVHAWDWGGAEEAYRAAVRFDPRYATGHQWYGELLYHLGRADESIAAMRRSAELDPLAPIAAVALAYTLTVARHVPEALREAERAVELAPNLGIALRALAFANLMAGNGDSAYQQMRRASELEPEFALRLAQVGYVAAKTGRRREADEALAELQRRATRGRVNPYVLTWIHLGLGDLDRAADMFEQSVSDHDRLLTGYSVTLDPAFDPIRNTPEFQRGLARMGLK
jgi:TolB-like protein/tetratricopeptide (TPR) repeat protein